MRFYKIIPLLLAVVIFVYAGLALAQTSAIPAQPAQQAKVKPLYDELQKADKARVAKLAALSEAQAVRDAETALTKAREALDKAAGSLPETIAWRETYAKLLDESYRAMAAQSLSSREYQPQFTEKGELTFARWTPPKQ